MEKNTANGNPIYSRSILINMSKESNILVFQQSMAMIRSDEGLKGSVEASVRDQEVVPHGTEVKAPEGNFETEVSVTAQRSFQAAKGLTGRTAVLNFASYTRPGGGVENGASAQEEGLCRISTLYPCLTDARAVEGFYDRHRNAPPMYTSDLVYTPGITVFRSDDDTMSVLAPEERYTVDVVTCAAPNLSRTRMGHREQYRVHRERIGRIAAVAASHGDENIVLGAFGCGVFRNDPYAVAEASLDALEDVKGCFKKAVFAVYGNEDNLRAFMETVGKRRV